MKGKLKVICLGDVVGRPGRKVMKELCGALKAKHKADLVIANGENAAGGAGIDAGTAMEIKSSGVDLITLGDHAFQRKGSGDFLEKNADWCIRPANYPSGAQGRGWCIWKGPDGLKVGVLNVLGRVFINGALDCPYRTATSIVENELAECQIKICDFHAEATSEKGVMSRILDGKVSLLFGTHTHVQTADEQISDKGTAFISDLGMCGSQAGVLGMNGEVATYRLTTGLPAAYEVAEGKETINGIVVDFDLSSKKAVQIVRLRETLSSGKASPHKD